MSLVCQVPPQMLLPFDYCSDSWSMLTLNQTVSVEPTPTATALGTPTETSTAPQNGGNSNDSTVIDVASGLGSFIVGCLVLWFSVFVYLRRRKEKATKESPAKDPAPIPTPPSDPENVNAVPQPVHRPSSHVSER